MINALKVLSRGLAMDPHARKFPSSSTNDLNDPLLLQLRASNIVFDNLVTETAVQ